MRVLLDENLPPLLAQDFGDHDCSHVKDLGWQGVQNGELLRRAEDAGFQVLVTLDSNIPSQNELSGRNTSIYVLQPEGQGLKATKALVAEMLNALPNWKPGQVDRFSNRRRPR